MLEKIYEGLSVLGIGMGTVFSVLLILMAIISLMRLAMKLISKSPTVKPAAVIPSPVPVIAANKSVSDEELIAVMSAALAAYSASENIPAQRLVVRSVRRITNWSKN